MEFTQNKLISNVVEAKPLGHKPKVVLPAEQKAGRVEANVGKDKKAPAKATPAKKAKAGKKRKTPARTCLHQRRRQQVACPTPCRYVHYKDKDFVSQATNLPPLRQRYLTFKHTVNSLLFKQWGDGTMALLDTEKAKQIKGIHFSAQHQADSKGKQEGRVIGDLSGQHDPAYTPLNGTSDSKDALPRDIAEAWGDIKHPR